MSSFEMTAIPAGRECGWTVVIDGEPTRVGMLEIVSQYGTLYYGMRPEGYDGWVFKEPGGGGSITIPFSQTPTGDILVGMILEDRPNMGGKRWCAIGGFKDAGETALTAAVREGFEEVGYDFSNTARKLEGSPGNFNRIFSLSDPEKDEGVHSFAALVPFTLLEEKEDGFGFREELASEDRKSLLAKGDGHVRFFPWKKAARMSADVLFSHGLVQLIASLE